MFQDPSAYDRWAIRWRARLDEEPQDSAMRRKAMAAVNPAYIPRNHIVEQMIQAAVTQQNFTPFEELLDVISNPYNERPGMERFATPARPEESVLQTFCGT